MRDLLVSVVVEQRGLRAKQRPRKVGPLRKADVVLGPARVADEVDGTTCRDREIRRYRGRDDHRWGGVDCRDPERHAGDHDRQHQRLAIFHTFSSWAWRALKTI